MKSSSSYIKLLPYLVWMVFLVAGLSVYKDYGLAWDEEAQMVYNGVATSEFIKTNNGAKFVANPEKYHGPAFEVVLYQLQELFKKTQTPEAYFFRHLVTFLCYWLSALALLQFIYRVTSNHLIASIGMLWYFLMPRFYAEAFYNTKDIIFYCLVLISITTFYNLLIKPGYKNTLLHSLVCGFAIGVRIMGIILPFISIFIFLLYYRKKTGFMPALKSVALLIILTLSFIIIFWPVLWMNPVQQFSNAFSEMSRFPWAGDVLYQGEFIPATSLPWHYSIVWMLITIPEYIILLFLTGIILFIFKFKPFPITASSKNGIILYAFCIFFGVLFSVIFLNTVVYDGWRHIYFLFAPILVIAILTFDEICRYISGKKKIYSLVFIGIFIGWTCYTGFQIVKMHPYQNVYFNTVSGMNKEENRFKFELDYWGLSFREAIENLLIHDTCPSFTVHFPNDAGRLNLQMLDQNSRNRIQPESFDKAEYFITNYRWAKKDYPEYERIDSIKVNNLIISSTYKMR